MDAKKLQFLQAVVGIDGAMALAKAAEKADELEQAIFPRTILAWLDVTAPFGHEGTIPGVDIHFNFNKSEKGFKGSIVVKGELYSFENVPLAHIAGCVAVALGLDHERLNPLVKSEQLAKLGKSIDLLVKSHLVKTSWNVKARRKYHFEPGSDKPAQSPLLSRPLLLGSHQVEARRHRYAQSIGLNPYRDKLTERKFPQSKGGTNIPYDNQFPLEHETAHAMMAPAGRTIADYQKELSGTDSPGNGRGDLESEEFQRHAVGTQQENIANQLEHHIDKRAGVDPKQFASPFRTPSFPMGIPSHSESKYPVREREGNALSSQFTKPVREDARAYAQRFDEGARFNKEGKIQPPSGIDAKINARAKKGLVKEEIKTIQDPKLKTVPDPRGQIVYRVQNAVGHGPYNGIGPEGTYAQAIKHYGMGENIPSGGGSLHGVVAPKRGSSFNAQPDPISDFPFKEWDGLPREQRKKLQFGFESPTHAREWFGNEALTGLQERGYSLQPIKAKQMWRSKTGRQLVYLPHEEAPVIKKAAIKPNKTIKLPGTTAKPTQPQGPMAPTLVQPKNQKQMAQGAAGTAQSPALPQMSTMAKKKPAMQVTKSEAQKKCQHCFRSQFANDKFVGCYCWNALAKSVKTLIIKEGYALEFGSAWDLEAIETLVETFRGK